MAVPDTFQRGFSSEIAVLMDKFELIDVDNIHLKQLLCELAKAVSLISKRLEKATEG